MTRHVALYCRLSPRPDGSYEGVDAQERWGREYAARAWPGVPVEVFADKGISAANGDERPGFERLRAWVRDGLAAHLWAVEQSRLERREVEWFTLAAELDAAGIGEVHTNRDGIVQVRGVAAGVKAVINADYVRELKRRVNDKLAENARRGLPPAGTPFGYRRTINDAGVKTLEIVPEQAELIRWAAERVLDGWSLTNIAADVEARGVRGPHGGKIVATTVRNWVTLPTVAGRRVYRGEDKGRGNWPAVLDEGTWNAARAKLTGARTVLTSNGGEFEVTAGMLAPPTARRYLLTGGLAVCGVCTKPLTGAMTRLSPSAAAKPYLKCHPNRGGKGCVGIGLDGTDKFVLDELWDKLDTPDFVAQVVGGDAHEQRRGEIARALSGLDGQRAELARMWGTPGRLSSAEWETARDALAVTERQLRIELTGIPAKVDIEQIRSARPAWPHMLLGEQREFIRMFIAKVTVNRATKRGPSGFDSGRVVIDWRTL